MPLAQSDVTFGDLAFQKGLPVLPDGILLFAPGGETGDDSGQNCRQKHSDDDSWTGLQKLLKQTAEDTGDQHHKDGCDNIHHGASLCRSGTLDAAAVFRGDVDGILPAFSAVKIDIGSFH